MSIPVDRFVDFFETLSEASVERMNTVYAANVHFKDPFNEVNALPDVQRIFHHMYKTLERPRFVVTGQVVDGQQCFLTWNFEFHFRTYRPSVLQTIHGTSHLAFNEAGLVVYHRDYWDAAEELYEKLPLIGALMRWLKKRAAS